ncbi:MAG TPA: hypothetical protein VJT49_04245 [Amycolatopsis sp.]|nr:hypothetical protein [Amycolatopsis sp.]HKS44322.1 hypothetical protein [Amycolatopsis sp.]
MNGERLDKPLDVDATEDLVLKAARGEIDVPEIAAGLRRFASP